MNDIIKNENIYAEEFLELAKKCIESNSIINSKNTHLLESYDAYDYIEYYYIDRGVHFGIQLRYYFRIVVEFKKQDISIEESFRIKKCTSIEDYINNINSIYDRLNEYYLELISND